MVASNRDLFAGPRVSTGRRIDVTPCGLLRSADAETLWSLFFVGLPAENAATLHTPDAAWVSRGGRAVPPLSVSRLCHAPITGAAVQETRARNNVGTPL